MKKNACFIAATGQDVGKTTICLGLIAGLQKKFSRIGFMKPVGQEHLKVEKDTLIDKDVVLFKDFFHLDAPYKFMSPVLFPKGFTRDYLDKKIQPDQMVQSILQSFESIYKENDFTVVEGTGHLGVGSIVNLNNAQVAKHLNLKIIIVAPGGLGSSFDTLALNKTLCEKYNVQIAGIILNKVLEEKKEMIIDYYQKALKMWNIPLIGVIPYNQFLSSPSMNDFVTLFQTSLINGHNYKYRHFKNIHLVASSVAIYENMIQPNQLIITPASREDIILATLTKYWDLKVKLPEADFLSGMILTGTTPPSKSILKEVQKTTIPMIYANLSSFEVMKKITSFTAKLRIEDPEKINKAIEIVEECINFDLLLKYFVHSPSK